MNVSVKSQNIDANLSLGSVENLESHVKKDWYTTRVQRGKPYAQRDVPPGTNTICEAVSFRTRVYPKVYPLGQRPLGYPLGLTLCRPLGLFKHLTVQTYLIYYG